VKLNKFSPVSDRAEHRLRARKRDSAGSVNVQKVEEKEGKTFWGQNFSQQITKDQSNSENKKRGLTSSFEVDYNESDITGLLFMLIF
jgi:hypothetical protein